MIYCCRRKCVTIIVKLENFWALRCIRDQLIHQCCMKPTQKYGNNGKCCWHAKGKVFPWVAVACTCTCMWVWLGVGPDTFNVAKTNTPWNGELFNSAFLALTTDVPQSRVWLNICWMKLLFWLNEMAEHFSFIPVRYSNHQPLMLHLKV